MGGSSPLGHESFITKLSRNSESGDALEGVFDISCSWYRAGDSSEAPRSNYSLVFVDIKINVQPLDAAHDDSARHEKSDGLKDLVAAVQSSDQLMPGDSWSGRVLVVIPTRAGYLGRSKCFQQRFTGCRDLGVLRDRSVFGRPLDSIHGQDLLALLDGCLFMFLRAANDIRLSDEYPDRGMDARINFSWLLNREPRQKTLVIVDAHFNPTSYLPLYEAATELGVKVVVLDRPGHWLSDHSFRQLYEAFIPIDMTPNDQFHERIAAAVRSYGHVDGLCAIATYCLAPVARATALLGLPAESSDAIACANNKYETRVLARGYAPPVTALVTDVDHLKNLIAQEAFIPHYPLITKPSHGAGSSHVYRANNEVELLEAVGHTCQTSGKKVLIEPYIDGPELDVNLVLLNGELIFFEIADDFPSAGDNETATESDFLETTNVLPSRLPANEYAIVRQKLHQLLLKIGLKTGVFHLEARVQDSSMAYSEVNDGLIDLVPRTDKTTGSSQTPSCFLIEINPRPPGFQGVAATRSAYGVNMYDLHVLSSLGEHERMRAQAKPFEPSSSFPNHARAWSQLVFMKVGKGGICDSDDVCGDVLRRLNPNDRALVTDAMCCFGRGDLVPGPQPGIFTFAASFNLTSRENCHDNLRVARILQQEFFIPVVSLNWSRA